MGTSVDFMRATYCTYTDQRHERPDEQNQPTKSAGGRAAAGQRSVPPLPPPAPLSFVWSPSAVLHPLSIRFHRCRCHCHHSEQLQPRRLASLLPRSRRSPARLRIRPCCSFTHLCNTRICWHFPLLDWCLKFEWRSRCEHVHDGGREVVSHGGRGRRRSGPKGSGSAQRDRQQSDWSRRRVRAALESECSEMRVEEMREARVASGQWSMEWAAELGSGRRGWQTDRQTDKQTDRASDGQVSDGAVVSSTLDWRTTTRNSSHSNAMHSPHCKHGGRVSWTRKTKKEKRKHFSAELPKRRTSIQKS